MRCWL
jgi:hypothetical protein